MRLFGALFLIPVTATVFTDGLQGVPERVRSAIDIAGALTFGGFVVCDYGDRPRVKAFRAQRRTYKRPL